MHWPSFHRARKRTGAPAGLFVLSVVGGVTLLTMPLVLVAVGLWVHLLVGRGGSLVPRDWVLGPWASGQLFGLPTLDTDLRYLVVLLPVGVGLMVLHAVALLAVGRAAHRAAASGTARIREAIVRQAQKLDTGDWLGPGQRRPDDLLIERCEALYRGLFEWRLAWAYAMGALVALLAVALAVNWLFTLLVALLGWFLWRMFAWYRQRTEQMARLALDRADHEQALLLQLLHASPVASGMHNESRTEFPLAGELRRWTAESRKAEIRRSGRGAVLALLIAGGAILPLLVVGLNVLAEPPRMSVAGFVVILFALAWAVAPAVRLYHLPNTMSHADAAAADILAFLDRAPPVAESPDARPLDRLQHGLELNDVTMHDHGGQRVLDAVTLSIAAGQRVGVLSSDGRSTLALAGLLVRNYDPDSGLVLFDGNDIRQAALDSLRRQVAVVAGQRLLFTATVADNIGQGRSNYEMQEIAQAAKQAGAYDLIQQLPQGWRTIVGERGERLERFDALRIALARAILWDPSVLLVEEPDPLDDESARQLDEVLRALAENRTLIVIPNHPATLRWLDHIVLLHEGRIDAQGTHAKLLQSSALYRHLNYVRFDPLGRQRA